jgi:peptidoglycan hydrolase CwlO-like protein
VKSLTTSAICGAVIAAAVIVASSANCLAQNVSPPTPATASHEDENVTGAVHDLQEQVRQLREVVDEMRTENAQSRTEMRQLRQELQSTRSLLEKPAAERPANRTATATPAEPAAEPPASTSAYAPVSNGTAEGVTSLSSVTPAPTSSIPSSSSIEERVQKLEESTSLLGSEVNEQHQTKVETASKYHARLSGIVLMNAFRNVGGSNNLDYPDVALPVSSGTSLATVGATLRQSEIGLEVFGPTVAGARTSANVQLDFAGGFPSTANGENFGLVRLQTASLRLDWEHTSVIAGQDSLFISPLSPTSFASLATPAFGLAGNLWGWTPQVRVEHRFDLSDDQRITIQAGILDNLNWGFPNSEFFRSAQAGEQSGQPAFATRAAWSRRVFDHPLSFGVAGYYGRQDWGWDRYVDAWSGMADWQIPILRRLTLSGEFYRGRGIGGLGAGVGRAVLYGGSPSLASTPIRGLDSIGGWSQVKLQLTPKLEVNGVIAEDNPFAGDVRGFATDTNNFVTILGRNRGALGNFVYRPRSDLLFSAEFRRLRSFPVYSDSNATNQVNLAMGILF